MKISAFLRKGGRAAEPRLLHPDDWPQRTGKARVLIENPDRADLWAHAEILREAGYDVAQCHGPTKPHEHVPWFRRRPFEEFEPSETGEAPTSCPLLVEGRCALVDGADVVVTTTALGDGREIIAALSSKGSPPLVVEGPEATLERDRDVTGAATPVVFPVTEKRLLTAVEDALASRTD